MSMRLMRVFAGWAAPVHVLAKRCGHRIWRKVGKV